MNKTEIISDATLWPRIAANRQQHAAIQRWLRANGIDPYDVLAGGTVAIEDLGTHGRRIRYEHLLRNQEGRLLRSADGALHFETRTAALVIGPPEGLLSQPVRQEPAAAPDPEEAGAAGDAAEGPQAALALPSGQDPVPAAASEES